MTQNRSGHILIPYFGPPLKNAGRGRESRCGSKMMTAYDCDRINTVILRVPTNNQIRQIAGLYRAQEWWQAGDDESPQLIPRLIAGSHCFVAALEGEDIVGMGRAISDGVSDAYIHAVSYTHLTLPTIYSV